MPINRQLIIFYHIGRHFSYISPSRAKAAGRRNARIARKIHLLADMANKPFYGGYRLRVILSELAVVAFGGTIKYRRFGICGAQLEEICELWKPMIGDLRRTAGNYWYLYRTV